MSAGPDTEKPGKSEGGPGTSHFPNAGARSLLEKLHSHISHQPGDIAVCVWQISVQELSFDINSTLCSLGMISDHTEIAKTIRCFSCENGVANSKLTVSLVHSSGRGYSLHPKQVK